MGTALYVSAMSEDIGCAFGNLGSIAGAQSAQRGYAMKARLQKIIEFHAELIEIRESLRNIMSAMLFIKIISMGVFFAVCLLRMEVVSDVNSANRNVFFFSPRTSYHMPFNLCFAGILKSATRTLHQFQFCVH